MKKIFIIVLFVLSLFVIQNGMNKVDAATDALTTDDTFEIKTDRDFRAVWISPLVSDISRYTNKSGYQSRINDILDVMEYYNFNVMIFHVRIYNDALYKSNLNNWSSYYSTNPDWDALPWIIEECHRRGIEFHAWMNPYRVRTGGKETDLTALARQFPATNPASNPANLIAGTGTIILNPGLYSVRSFLVRTCLELVENYDVDAIHFDDYFYVEGIGNADNSTYLATANGLSIDDWRREQVSLFIKDLHDGIKTFNEVNNRAVQIGISPTPVYDDGDGNVTYDENGTAITSGSLTSSGGHYDDYHYADTKRWIDNEWIDYFVPQCYHGLSSGNSEFTAAVDWWSKVVKYKDVNLYIGIGLYRVGNSDWLNSDEFLNEMKVMSEHPEVQGFSIFSYKHLQNAYNSPTGQYGLQISKVLSYWENKAIPSPIKGEDSICTEEGSLFVNRVDNGYKLSIKKQDGVKWYAIYRSLDQFTYDNNDFVALTGYETNGYVEYIDEVASDSVNYYHVVPLTYGNNPVGVLKADTKTTNHLVTFLDENNNVIKEQYVNSGDSATYPEYVVDGYDVSWDKEVTSITGDMTVKAILTIQQRQVTYLGPNQEELLKISVDYNTIITPLEEFNVEGYDFTRWEFDFTKPITEDTVITGRFSIKRLSVTFYADGKRLKVVTVNYGEGITDAPVVESTSERNFVGWNKDLTSIKENMVVTAIFDTDEYAVSFYVDGRLYRTVNTRYGTIPVAPSDPVKEGYTFIGWDKEIVAATSEMSYNAQFTIATYTVKFYVDGELVSTQEVEYGSVPNVPTVPQKEGHTFVGWSESLENIKSNMDINAQYEANQYQITIKNNDETIVVINAKYGDIIVIDDVKKEVSDLNFSTFNLVLDDTKVEENITSLTVTSNHTISLNVEGGGLFNCNNGFALIHLIFICSIGCLSFVIRRRVIR